jgi:ribosomal protein S18 acetylase RimI-like enzyme
MTEDRPIVRKATESDLLGIVEHYGKNGKTPWDPFTSLDRLRGIPLDGLLVAEVNGKYAGFLYWFPGTIPIDDTNVENYAFIYEINILKEFRMKKVGHYLELEAFKMVELMKLPVMYTRVHEKNWPLRELYEKIGFTTYGRTLHMRYLYPHDPARKQVPHNEAMELSVYMTELKEQCRILSTTYHEVEILISEGPPTDVEGKRRFHAKIWSRIQSVLSATSAISHILWPQPLPRGDGSDKKAIHRGLELRRFLGLQGTRSLFPTKVRNAFEHIDERISEWLPYQPGDNPWGWCLSPFPKGEDPPGIGTALRYFNINTKELRVAGASCNLRDITNLASEIEKRLPEGAQVNYGSIDDWNPDNSEWKKDLGQ